MELSSDASSKVITLLASFNPCGTRTLEMLGSYDQNIAALHESAVPRMALVRHLIALVLWDKILRRFAFGLDAATNKNLRAIERELIAGNLQYNISDSRTGFRKSFGDPSSLRSSGTTSC